MIIVNAYPQIYLSQALLKLKLQLSQIMLLNYNKILQNNIIV